MILTIFLNVSVYAHNKYIVDGGGLPADQYVISLRALWDFFNSKVVVVGHLATHSDNPFRRRASVSFYFLLVQDTEAPTTHDKPGSFTCPVFSTDTI